MTRVHEPDFSDLLTRARAVAPKLGSATDELNTALSRAEEAIASLSLGVTASVSLEDDDDSDCPLFEVLTFGKEGARWRLLIEKGTEGEPDTWRALPLVNASREKRLRAADRLPELVGRLIAQAEDQIEQVRARAAAVDKLVATIEGLKVSR